MNFVHDPLASQRTNVALGGVSDAAVAAGAAGSVSAKLRAISRDLVALQNSLTASGAGGGDNPGVILAGILHALTMGGIVATASFGALSREAAPAATPDGEPVITWHDELGRMITGGYDAGRRTVTVEMPEAPSAKVGPVVVLLDAVSEAKTSFGLDCRGYQKVAIHVITAASDGGVDATVKLKRRLRATDVGADFGETVTLSAAGETCLDVTNVNLGILSVVFTRTQGTVTVLAQAVG